MLPLEPAHPHLRNQQSQNDGAGKSDRQIHQRHHAGVAEDERKRIIRKQIDKVFPADPLAVEDTSARLEILKRDDHAEHRDIIEHNEENGYGDEEKVQPPISLPILLPPLFPLAFLFLSGCRLFGRLNALCSFDSLYYSCLLFHILSPLCRKRRTEHPSIRLRRP